MDEAEIVASYKDTGAWRVAEGTGGEQETMGAVDAKGKGKEKEKGKGKGKAVGEVYEDRMEQQGRSRELFEEEDQMFELDEDVEEEFEEVEVVEDEADVEEGEAESQAGAGVEEEAEGRAEKAAVQETVAEVARKTESEIGSKALTMGEEVAKEERADNKRGKARANGLVAKEREASGEEKRTRRVAKKKAVRKYVSDIEDEEGDEVFDQEGDDSGNFLLRSTSFYFMGAEALVCTMTRL